MGQEQAGDYGLGVCSALYIVYHEEQVFPLQFVKKNPNMHVSICTCVYVPHLYKWRAAALWRYDGIQTSTVYKKKPVCFRGVLPDLI